MYRWHELHLRHHLTPIRIQVFPFSSQALAVRANLAGRCSIASAGSRLSSAAARWPKRRFPVSRRERGRERRWSCRVDFFRASLLQTKRAATSSSSQCRHLIPSGPQRALPGQRSVISGQNSAMLDRKRPLSSQQRDLSGAKTEPSQANVDLPKASAGPS